MKLDEVKSIRKTYDDDEANDLLSKGYKIIKILSTKQRDEDSDSIRPCYILGLEKDSN